MFGPRISSVFKSRWNALLWSAGILLTAYCSVPAAQEADQHSRKDRVEQVGPWAK
jgi:hypothetical protein